MAKFSVEHALLKAKSSAKKGEIVEALKLYNDILQAFPNNKRAQQGLAALNKPIHRNHIQAPPQEVINQLINLYHQGQLAVVVEQAKALILQYPDAFKVWNILGAANKRLGRFQAAAEAFKKAIKVNPTYAEGFSNLGLTLQVQGKLEEAIVSYSKALTLKPNYAEAFYNMGNALTEQGKLNEAIDAYENALAIKPDNADTYNNMGNALREYGKLEKAIEAYNKALAIKPNYAEAYNNLGLALGEQGKLDEAIEAHKKALTIKPDYAAAHLNLSSVNTYNSEIVQIRNVEALLERTDLTDSDRCNLLYTHAKMRENLQDFTAAFNSYMAGGILRQKLLGYEFTQDENLFSRIKQTAPHFKHLTLNVTGDPNRPIPVFIIGMPRTGTTLVEQIISSHSKVTGAGELNYVSRFGGQIASGLKVPTLEAVAVFRDRYLAELSKRADGRSFVIDKMPQNFRYVALICSALPEAKIIHSKRNSKATCWSNFKHYFASKGLGYSYSLRDTVKYYGLYKDLMQFWYQSYDDRIYNFDYDKLTENQEPETRRLFEYLSLEWEDACLAPQNNKRSVRTASNQQVRRKVYTGSSEAWRKYEPFLHGIFDELEA